jgi:hypothetical protein
MHIRKKSNYMKVFFVSFIIILTGFLNGCGYIEGSIQKSERSYLWFTGNTESAIVYIDNKEFVRLTASAYSDVDPKTGEKRHQTVPIYYQIDPGKHELRIERDGRVLVNRTLLLGNQMTREIEIP